MIENYKISNYSKIYMIYKQKDKIENLYVLTEN